MYCKVRVVFVSTIVHDLFCFFIPLVTKGCSNLEDTPCIENRISSGQKLEHEELCFFRFFFTFAFLGKFPMCKV